MEIESYNIEAQDRLLIEQIMDKESEDAKRALYERYANRVYLQCRNYWGLSREDAEDIVQDVFSSVFDKFSSLEDPDKFGSWLKAITRNRCLQVLKDKLRKIMATKGYESEYLLHLERPDEYLVREKEIEIIKDMIASVGNDKHRRTMELFYFEGISCEEISKKQGIKVTTVTTRLSRFRARVKLELIRKVLELRAR